MNQEDSTVQKTDDRKEVEEIKRVFATVALLAPFAYPLLAWPIVIQRGNAPIAATNGVTIFINPDKWNKTTFQNRVFIALHEWMHIALMHTKRLRTRKHRMFNYACDFSINAMIKSLKDFEMPTGLYDLYYQNQSAEEIYKDLDAEVKKRQEQKIEPFCTVCDRVFKPDDHYCDDNEDVTKCPACHRATENGKPIEDFEGPIDREAAINQLMTESYGAPWGNDLYTMPQGTDEQKILDEVIKAAARHKASGRGLLPGAYEDYIKEIKESEVPFERILLRFARECLRGSVDRNPYRPDPKYLPFDIFVPREHGISIPKLVLIVDTSGSMDSSEFEFAAGHLKKLGTICDTLTLITADTMVHEVVRVRNIVHEIKKRKVKFAGRGGTDMHEAFKKADALNPKLIILYSDMEIGAFPPKPRAPVIFLVRERWKQMQPNNPYGIYLTVKEKLKG